MQPAHDVNVNKCIVRDPTTCRPQHVAKRLSTTASSSAKHGSGRTKGPEGRNREECNTRCQLSNRDANCSRRRKRYRSEFANHTQKITYMTLEHYFCCAQCNNVTLGRRLPIQPSAVGNRSLMWPYHITRTPGCSTPLCSVPLTLHPG